MKKILLLISVVFLLGCSKNESINPDEDYQSKRLPLNIQNMVSYVNQDYDVVRNKLKDYAILDGTEMGDRNFTVVVTDANDIVLGCEIKESNNNINEINCEYKGVAGGPSVGDPYENELWYFYINKVQDIYKESNSRVYKKTSIRLPSNNADLINMVKKEGYRDASYYAKWNLENTKEIYVFHSNTGDFLLQIKNN